MSIRKSLVFVGVSALIASFGGAATAQEGAQPEPKAPPAGQPAMPKDDTGMQHEPGMHREDMGKGAAMSDQDIIMKLQQVNAGEIQMGNLARTNAQNKDVKAYGKKLVEEHQRFEKKLADVAKAEGLKMPATTMAPPPGSPMATEIDKLKTLHGAEFDKEFLQQQVSGHDEAIDLINANMDKVQDPQLKKTLQQASTNLQNHRKMAEDLLSKTKAG
jgi:putative membrane protein